MKIEIDILTHADLKFVLENRIDELNERAPKFGPMNELDAAEQDRMRALLAQLEGPTVACDCGVPNCEGPDFIGCAHI